MKLFILSFTLAAVLVSARELEDQELQVSYKEAIDKFHPENAHTFLSSGSGDEHFRSFCKFAQAVEDHNTNDGEHWLGEINAFAVMTESERQQYLGLNVSSLVVERREPHKARVLEKRQDNVAVDYSEYLPGIKNQGSCGSCWTFGAVAALEYQLNRRRTSTTPVALSEQQYLDCVYEGSRNGCNGGWPGECYEWTRDNGNMIADQSDYKYRGADGSCQGGKNSAISGMQMVEVKYLPKTDAAMLTAVKDEKIGVLSVAIGVHGSFSSYKSGVYYRSSCSSINHAVDVVGYGTLNGEDYWQVRNSWGDNWGDNGHIKMKRGVNTCAIATWPHYPYLTGTPDDDGNDNEDEDEDEKDDNDDDDEEEEEEEKKTCKWIMKEGTKLKGKLSGLDYNMEEAKEKCKEDSTCAGISCKNMNKCMLNKKTNRKDHEKFDGYLMKNCNEDNDDNDDNDGCPSGTMLCDDGECKHEHMC